MANQIFKGRDGHSTTLCNNSVYASKLSEVTICSMYTFKDWIMVLQNVCETYLRVMYKYLDVYEKEQSI